MFRMVKLPDSIQGRLYLSSMPGRYEPIEEDISEIDLLNIKRVVCLADMHEIELKSPEYAQVLKEHNYTWIQKSFPISDYGIPSPILHDALLTFSKEVAGFLQSGENILIHCAAGVGRTGTFATMVLMALGLSDVEVTDPPQNDRSIRLNLTDESGSK